ncbi:gp224 [Sphingomonas phage PAU]|uniref:gp224 n=1 Tax=Sphingomonas phage PAU TaxID=1150991 RepID=UPI000257337E|nr:gp224 [Sphingomonas phage PAU]AFF28222.1 gp224 [Sphingomonas phage PAU]
MTVIPNQSNLVDSNIQSELQVKQEKPSKLLLVDCIKPHNNHSVFEINLSEQTIQVASFVSKDTITWWEALDGSYKNLEIIRKPNCVYHTALNVENLAKRVKRDYDYDLSGFEYIADNSNGGSNLKVNVNDLVSSV